MIYAILIQQSYAQESEENINHKNLTARNQQNFVFDTTSLYGVNRDIDLSIFNISHYVAPGLYNVSLTINNKESIDTTVKFDHADASSSAVLCLDPKLLNLLDLKEKLLKDLLQQENECLNIKDINPDAYYDFSLSQLKLDLYIPLVAIQQRPEGYINPKRFDQGVSSAFIAYNANMHKNDQQTQNYLNLNAGVNFAGWYFRHNGYFESTDEGDLGRYRSSQNTLYRDIDRLRSRLSLGEFYSNNLLSENLSLVGVQLASDDNMLPWSMRTYAPIIQAVANTNALVKVFQNGQKIYEKSVPAGAFELTDLNTSANGELTVEIIENGGEKRVLYFPMQLNINLLKKGLLQYNVAYGRYKIANKLTQEQVFQANLNYGLTNHLTIGSAMTFAEPYKSILVSASLNSLIGGINTTVDYSRANLYGQDRDGQRYQFKYSYFWEAQNLNINANLSRQSRDYQTANNTLSIANYDQLNDDEYRNLWNNNNLKTQYSLSLSKSFQDRRWGSFQVAFYQNTYWTDQQHYNQYTFSYGNRWHKLNYNLGVNHSQDRFDNQKNNTYYASISIPLEWRKSNLYLSSNIQRAESDAMRSDSANVNLSGTAGQDNNINFGIGINRNDYGNGQNIAYSGNMNYLHPYVNLGATLYHDEHDSQYSLSANGGVVAHRYGITATNHLNDTYTIVHVDKGRAAGVNNAWGIRLDRFGNAIYSTSSPYAYNLIQIDPELMPANMNIKSNQATVIPRQYSSTLVKFNAEISSLYVLRIQSPLGNLPMGAEVRTAAQKVIGRLAQSNQVLLDQFDPQQDHQLTVVWGDMQQNHCQIQLPRLKSNKDQALQIVPVECQ
ncbi:hypothetical protein BFG52_00705 [Acinetobacter larvae]|uniref:Fimbrial protein n=2 Tax=Acinetobacter larvae TaxID=1789224 RepID=A0A1B2LVQ8_9GAMM|nr:hypothetical protein BFG52_00705 [Acinetobacter larvae]